MFYVFEFACNLVIVYRLFTKLVDAGVDLGCGRVGTFRCGCFDVGTVVGCIFDALRVFNWGVQYLCLCLLFLVC